jgi:TrpR-related protein YerC/YecD
MLIQRNTATGKSIMSQLLKKETAFARPAASLEDALLTLKTAEECRAFLTDLCTPGELGALQERWQIAQLLDAGQMTYREIHAATGASTTTVARVARFLLQERHRGYQGVLERLKKK